MLPDKGAYHQLVAPLLHAIHFDRPRERPQALGHAGHRLRAGAVRKLRFWEEAEVPVVHRQVHRLLDIILRDTAASTANIK